MHQQPEDETNSQTCNRFQVAFLLCLSDSARFPAVSWPYMLLKRQNVVDQHTTKNKQPLIMVFYSIVTKKEIELGYMTETNLLLLSILWHLQANYESDSLKQALQHTQTQTHKGIFCLWAPTLTLSEGGYK